MRTPLNSIIGFSELMVMETLGKIEPPVYAEYTHMTLNSATHLLQLVNDILDVSAIEAGGLNLEEQPVDMDQLCKDSINGVRPLAEERNLTIQSAPGPALPTILADRTRLEQIFLNLLTNAIKFAPVGGDVTLMRNVSDTGDIIVSILDNGPGMTGPEIDAAFEPFRQIDRGTTGKHEGVGLGLSLSRTLAEAHGGSLSLESVKGEFTRAVLTLPAERVSDDL